MNLRVNALYAAIVLSFSLLPQANAAGRGSTFQIGTNDFLLDGKPFQIRCGEIHAPRVPPEYWHHRLRMARSMGLNTVCAYLFWNLHEPEPGVFNFRGNADAAAFCRAAQEEGLKVILRPGPYSCAEWDFGGFPYWLLKEPGLKVRTRDPKYLAACKRYIDAVGRELGPLQVTRGGPIIMVQVENEYGSYGNDREYIGIIRDYIKGAGFEVPLFTCDGPVQLANDTREDLFCVVNFGSNPEANFKALRKARPAGPLMCGEYYPGWFDSWGKPHHSGDTGRIAQELEWMLSKGASFSIYMVHGGTSFGFTAGANCPPFSPQVTSYDYDAPISEAGWAAPKFEVLRGVLTKHLAPGELLPAVPERNPVIEIPSMELTKCAPLFENLPAPKRQERTACMESFDQASGCIMYRTTLPAGEAGLLRIQEVHDYALVFLDAKKVATLDRRRNQATVKLPARTARARLDVLVDTFGRVNYGGHIHDRKGITEKVELIAEGGTKVLEGWEIYTLPLDQRQLKGLRFKDGKTGDPAFYRAVFRLEKAGDTFLDLSSWGKGVVWVNGHNLGRFWNIGPHQTLYCPGPWLRKGDNEIVVFEINGAAEHRLTGKAEPILDVVREVASVKHRKPGESLDLSGLLPQASGSFAGGAGWQVVRFEPVSARYVCLEALSSQTGDEYATCAELQVLDAQGKDLSRENWKVVYADSEETDGDDGNAENVFDLQPTTFWHTQWESAKPKLPHQVVIDLGSEQVVSGIRYLPRQENPNGRIKDYKVYVGKGQFRIGKQ